MNKKDIVKVFIDEICISPPTGNNKTSKSKINYVDEIWSVDLADFVTSNNECFRYVFNIIDNFPKFTWGKPLNNKHEKTKTDEFSDTFKTSERRLLKMDCDRGKEFYNSDLQNFLKLVNIHSNSKCIDKRISMAKRVIRTMRSFLKTQFLKQELLHG